MASPQTRNFTSLLRASGFVYRARRTMGMPVINKTGSAIAANKLVVISGYDTTSKRVKVVLADADAAGLSNDVYVTQAAISNGGVGTVFKGFMSTANLNTNAAATVGDPVYLDTTAGAFTVTAPSTGASNVVIVGYVQVKSATIGQIAWDIQNAIKVGSGSIQTGADGTILVASGTISSANITGTGAGQLGHANGVELVAAGGATIINQLVYAIIENNFAVAAYTGGGATGIKIPGGVALSNTVANSVFVQAAANISVELTPPPSLTVASVYPLNNALNLVSASAPTQPGTAAGVIRWKIGYRQLTSALV